jgi:choline dehydrogenase-like flavoprotein
MTASSQPECEYVVVGSGAGGATVAARLAEAGKHVVLLEAGGDPRSLSTTATPTAAIERLRHDYDVPAFHAFASEHPAISWDFFVRHYDDEVLQRRDPKFVCNGAPSPEEGIFYPRASALGGCTAHNAMILVYPHNADWDYIATVTGDTTWSSANMRRYFERLEDCRHRPLHRLLSKLGLNLTRHGWNGWLQTQKAIPKAAMADRRLSRVLIDSVHDVFREDDDQLERVRWFLEGWMDPNDWRLVEKDATGLRYLPMTTSRHARTGARERVLNVAERYPDRLTIVLNALATKVILDDRNRAIGVEYLKGERLYHAHRPPSTKSGETRVQLASKEVILAGGSFNTPQLLMLSGIGPVDELRRHGIRARVVLPGVGRNLQDRYEVGVVNRMNMPMWQVFDGATFSVDDPQFAEWSAHRTGIYATNGAVLALFRKSTPEASLPDLFCMSMLANFRGYYPGYSQVFAKDLNALTWVVLKGHTGNHAGSVTLRTSDPLDTPTINFRYFSDQGEQDLKAVVEGIRFVRRVTRKLRERGLIASEEVPGDSVVSDAALAEFVRVNTWGHHACGTCAIGPPEMNGVVDGTFKVHHTQRLRVVDASVFPRIPGFFIVSAVYMIGEKAAESILADAAHETVAARESH